MHPNSWLRWLIFPFDARREYEVNVPGFYVLAGLGILCWQDRFICLNQFSFAVPEMR